MLLGVFWISQVIGLAVVMSLILRKPNQEYVSMEDEDIDQDIIEDHRKNVKRQPRDASIIGTQVTE